MSNKEINQPPRKDAPRVFDRRDSLREMLGITLTTIAGTAVGAAVGAEWGADDFDKALEIWAAAAEKTRKQLPFDPAAVDAILDYQFRNFFDIMTGTVTFADGSCRSNPISKSDIDYERTVQRFVEGFMGALVPGGITAIAFGPYFSERKEGIEGAPSQPFSRRRILEKSLACAVGGAFLGNFDGNKRSNDATEKWYEAAQATVDVYSQILKPEEVKSILDTQRRNMVEVALGHPVEPDAVADVEREQHKARWGNRFGLTGAGAGALAVAAGHLGRFMGRREAAKRAAKETESPER